MQSAHGKSCEWLVPVQENKVPWGNQAINLLDRGVSTNKNLASIWINAQQLLGSCFSPIQRELHLTSAFCILTLGFISSSSTVLHPRSFVSGTECVSFWYLNTDSGYEETLEDISSLLVYTKERDVLWSYPYWSQRYIDININSIIQYKTWGKQVLKENGYV